MPDNYQPSFFTHAHLSETSFKYLVIVLFVSSRSDVFPMALDVAKRAPLFATRNLEALRLFVSGFEPTFEGAAHAMDLIHYVRGWKGTHFYAKGRMVIGEGEQAFLLEAVLKCFSDSCAARDSRAHCFRLIDDPFNPRDRYQNFDHVAPYFRHIEVRAGKGEYVFPCRHMLQWFTAQWDHPASIVDQIQAEGVHKLCDVCPRFDPDSFGPRLTQRSKK